MILQPSDLESVGTQIWAQVGNQIRNPIHENVTTI